MSQNWSRNTLLFIASGKGRPEVVEMLLARGADVHGPDRSEMPPLINAIMHDDPEPDDEE